MKYSKYLKEKNVFFVFIYFESFIKVGGINNEWKLEVNSVFLINM